MTTLKEKELSTNYQPDKYHPERYALNSIDIKNWYIFGTLTWEDESRRNNSHYSQKLREYDFNHFMNVICSNFRLRKKYLEFYRGTEFGGGGQGHFNFLITKRHLEHIPARNLADFMEKLWIHELKPFDSEHRGIGMAKIRPYDAEKGEKGVKYVVKREYDEIHIPVESHPYFSKRLFKIIASSNSQGANYSLN